MGDNGLMTRNSLLEKAYWIAGIIVAAIALFAYFRHENSEQTQSGSNNTQIHSTGPVTITQPPAPATPSAAIGGAQSVFNSPVAAGTGSAQGNGNFINNGTVTVAQPALLPADPKKASARKPKPPVPSPTVGTSPLTVSAPNGIAIGGDNYGNPQVTNNFVDGWVPPLFAWKSAQSERDMARQDIKLLGVQPWGEMLPGGLDHVYVASVQITMSSDFYNPAFRVIADKPIDVLSVTGYAPEGRFSYSHGHGFSANEAEVALGDPRLLPNGRGLMIEVFSLDGQIQVTKVIPLRNR